MGDRLKEFFCVEQFTGREGKVRPNLRSDLICHVIAHVGGKRTPPIQKGIN